MAKKKFIAMMLKFVIRGYHKILKLDERNFWKLFEDAMQELMAIYRHADDPFVEQKQKNVLWRIPFLLIIPHAMIPIAIQIKKISKSVQCHVFIEGAHNLRKLGRGQPYIITNIILEEWSKRPLNQWRPIDIRRSLTTEELIALADIFVEQPKLPSRLVSSPETCYHGRQQIDQETYTKCGVGGEVGMGIDLVKSRTFPIIDCIDLRKASVHACVVSCLK